MIGYKRYTFNDRRNSFGLFCGISNITQQQAAFVFNKIGLVFVDIAFEIFGGMFTGEAVGVVAIGKQQDLNIHPFGQQHICSTQCSVNTRLVTII